MGENQTKKRKNYYKNLNESKRKKGSILCSGMKGFLCTSNRIRQGLTEALNLLMEYSEILDEIQIENKTETNENVKDTDKSKDNDLQKELENLRNSNKQLFQAINTNVTGCVFIKTKIKNPLELANSIFKDIKENNLKKAKYLCRLLPVEVTCKAYLDEIKKAACILFDKYFCGDAKTYSIIFNRRNNNNVFRDETIETLALLVKDRNLLHKVDLKNSELTITVDILKNICCLSVLENYFLYRKFNVLELCLNKNEGEDMPNLVNN